MTDLIEHVDYVVPLPVKIKETKVTFFSGTSIIKWFKKFKYGEKDFVDITLSMPYSSWESLQKLTQENNFIIIPEK